MRCEIPDHCLEDFCSYYVSLKSMQKKKLLSGIIKRHPDGFGFFIPDDRDHPDIYIPRNAMDGVMTNDRVIVSPERERNSDRFRGEIIKITERGCKVIVGRLAKLNATTAMIKDEGKGWGSDMRIAIENCMSAKFGDLVGAEIISYPESTDGFYGKVIEVIGDALDPLNDIKRVVLNNNIPYEFAKATLEQAKTYPINPTEEEFKGRTDLRNKNLITIDGATAKDFDDAVLVEMNENGFHLYVAIADVSHYVRIGSAIDKDAYERGTSVYFPNYVIPMLPEQLSNGLCSLNPHVPRLCLVAEIQFDFNGEMSSSKFYEAVMESKARVTYGEAQEVIDGAKSEKLDSVKENILRCADLAKILMAKRFRDGSLDLEIPETELEIDASGNPIDVIRSERLFSHRLIEEMMLAANVAVATFLHQQNVPALYRIHEEPNDQAIHLLEQYLWNFGSRIKIRQGKLQKQLGKALQEFHGKPEALVLNILTLRSMSQAKYHMDNVGHFGLGFEFYTHFTSPIRRYPDLIVHRLIKNRIMKNSQYRLMSEDDLLTAGTFLSACEQRSVKAERQIQGIKKARFVQKLIGQEFEGMISSVTKFGVFVLLRNFDLDGLVRLEDLGNEQFEYDEERIELRGRKSKKVFKIGDILQVQVVSSDIELGQVNFALVQSLDKKVPIKQLNTEGFVERVTQKKKNKSNESMKSAKKALNKSAKELLDEQFARKSKKPDWSKDSEDGPVNQSVRSKKLLASDKLSQGGKIQVGVSHDQGLRFGKPVKKKDKKELKSGSPFAKFLGKNNSPTKNNDSKGKKKRT